MTADRDFVPFSRPDIGEAEIAAVVSVMRSGWLTTGPIARAFETEFENKLGADCYAIAVNSATSGLHLALEALGIGPGDEVLVPTLTFTASAETVRYLGATPVLVDIEPSSLCISLADAARKLTPRTKAIMPVHYGGRACAMPPLLDFARQHGLFVVEDAAHALPTRYGGKLIGQWDTDVTVFSFYANKTLCTGEGGLLLTRNRALADRCRIMRLHGISRDAFDRHRSKSPSWEYDVVAPGFKYNLTDIAAAIGRVQLQRLEEMHHRRVQIATQFSRKLQGTGLVLPTSTGEATDHSWHLYSIQLPLNTRLNRAAVVERLFDSGIGCSVHYIPLHRMSYWRESLALSDSDFPIASDIADRLISLPIYSLMLDEEVDRVCESLLRMTQE
jgi:dTDP-4-amino-4,6-dideoxygalactose transaminase